jgi:hypothetical protein
VQTLTPDTFKSQKKTRNFYIKGSLLQLCVTSTIATSSSADTSVGPASVMVGNLVQGNRLAAAQGRDLGFTDDNKVTRILFKK